MLLQIESLKMVVSTATATKIAATTVHPKPTTVVPKYSTAILVEYIFRNNEIKFFYIIPRFHNPLGHCYSNSEKKKIVELAEKYDVYIVEDDFLGDLDPNAKSDPLFS